MENNLLDSYASQRQLNKYVAAQILLNGFIKADELTLLVLGLNESVLSLAQNLNSRYYEVWDNYRTRG